MNLKHASLGVMIGIAYTIFVKLSHLFFPELLLNEKFGILNGLFVSLIGIFFVLFAVIFYRDVTVPAQKELRIATVLGMFGPGLVTVLHLKKLIMNWPQMALKIYEISPALHHAILNRYIEDFYPLIFLLIALVVLYFFIVFYRKIARNRSDKLKPVTKYVIITQGIIVLIRMVSFFASSLLDRGNWFVQPGGLMSAIILPIYLLYWCVLIYFFWLIYNVGKKNLLTQYNYPERTN